MTGQPEDPDLEQLAADYPGWRIWRREDGIVCAWLLGTKPPFLLHAATVGEMRQAVAATKGGNESGSRH